MSVAVTCVSVSAPNRNLFLVLKEQSGKQVGRSKIEPDKVNNGIHIQSILFRKP